MDKRELVAFIKVLLGVLAAFIGIPLLLAGLFVYFVASTVDPTIAGEQQTQGWVDIGSWTTMVGFLLCLSALLCLKRDDRRLPDTSPPKEKICPNCGCTTAKGSKTCEWCGADLK